jgi:hypothetical protein
MFTLRVRAANPRMVPQFAGQGEHLLAIQADAHSQLRQCAGIRSTVLVRMK